MIAQTSITIRAGEAPSFEWKEYGLRLHVPEGALPPHLSESTLHIQASLCGQFEFPNSSELVSAVYWISCASKFSKPVTLDLQHCAVGQTSSLQFVRAKCTQKTLPYQFQPIDGVFICDSDYGSTSITHFSGIGIVRTLQSWLGRSSETYLAQVYLKNVNLNEWKVYFIVTKNLEPTLTVSTVDLEIFVYENFHGKFFCVKFFSWVSCTHGNYFTQNFFYTQARSKNLLCWRLPCIICDIQEAAIGTRL